MKREQKIAFLVEYGIPETLLETLSDDDLEAFIQDIFTDAEHITPEDLQ